MSIACPYERFGCVVLVTELELEQHLQESAAQHLVLLESKFRSIEEENKRLSHALQAAQTRSRKIDQIRVELIHENERLRKDLLSYSNPLPVEAKEAAAAAHAQPIEGLRSFDKPEAPLSMPLPSPFLPIPIPVSPSSKVHSVPSPSSISMSLPPSLVAANLPEEVIEKLTNENHALRSEVDELKMRLQIREEEALMAEEDGDLSSLDPIQRLQLSQFHRNRHGSGPPSSSQRLHAPGGLFFRSFGMGGKNGAAALAQASEAQAASSRAIMGRRMGVQDDDQQQVKDHDKDDAEAPEQLSQEEEREMYLQRIKHYHSMYRESYLELLRVEGILDETGYHPPPEDQSRPVHFGASARGGLRSLLCPVTWVEKIVDTVQHVSGSK